MAQHPSQKLVSTKIFAAQAGGELRPDLSPGRRVERVSRRGSGNSPAEGQPLLGDAPREIRFTGGSNRGLTPELLRQRERRIAKLNDRSFSPPEVSNSLYAILRDCVMYALSKLSDGFGSRHKGGITIQGGAAPHTTALQRRSVLGVQRMRKR